MPSLSACDAPAGPIDLSNEKITTLAAGTAANDAATFGQATFAPTAIKVDNFGPADPGDLVLVDATAKTCIITLPEAPVDKSRIAVKMIATAGGHSVTVTGGGADVFNIAAGSPTWTLSLAGQVVTVQYQAAGGIWHVISDGVPLSEISALSLPIGVMPQDAVADATADAVVDQVNL